MNNIKLIVGLANPGAKYELTRHNVGSWYVKLLAKHYNLLLKEDSNFFGYTAEISLINNNIFLLVPTTYMNFSGNSVFALARYYHIKSTEILVAHDELDLIPGTAKIKLSNSNNGHNGIKDIQSKFGDNSCLYRLRIGIGHPGSKSKVVKFVLSNPNVTEQKLIFDAINEAVKCTKILFNYGMNEAIKHLHTFSALNK